MKLTQQILAEQITRKAKEIGFMDVGFTSATELINEKPRLTDWLNKGRHANMDYMANHFEKRINPSHLVEGAKTVISLLHNYYPIESQNDPEAPIIARYAFGKDYHKVLKKKLKRLYNYIQSDLYPTLEGRYFVDSAPLLERALAKNAGLGWIGKNTNLINPKHGSYFFICELVVNLELPNGQLLNDYCGGCTKCIDACPTSALIAPYDLDANKCISYHTIENKGEISNDLKGQFNNRLFGCDICQEVCPWNRKSIPHSEPAFEPIPKLMQMTKGDWLSLSENNFETTFMGSPLKRTNYFGLRRNLKFIYSS